MKSKSLKLALYLVMFSVVLISCNNDDDASAPNIVERDRTEQQLADSDSLITYLSTHYYNSSFFETGTNHKYTDIVITELEEGDDVPDGNTLLINAVETHSTTYLETDYEYYVLKLNQGGGDLPKFTDQIRVRYEGASIASGEVFDSRATPENFMLTGVNANPGLIRGWQLTLPEFSTSLDFSLNNGIVEYNDYGLGIMFLPSGLGFYSGTNSGTSYDNLVFKFELLQYEEVDHDGDGIPSHMEDLDDNLYVLDDDTDEDRAYNYIDVDDDNDGVLTRDELMAKTYTEDETMNPFMSETAAQNYFDNNAASNELFDRIDFNSEDSTYELKTLIIMDSNDNNEPDYLEDTITISYNEEDEDS
ncbi:hypothetical protein [Winogradskyella sp.]|jgi:hypothetical protein|uniref:FKBP-type peptidyl-prolyl cis-trans isomerase n=1 Tax=Winogradskyella sp. TaxID=1883156 RepID=UPI0026005758|nr:hypothetical protein [Winogradskyella sp.]MCT4630594.1 hypothetical protein [Winogradskyella sp.]